MTVRTTSWLRQQWAPACQVKQAHNIIEAYAALDVAFKAFGYKPKSGQTGARNCRRITGGSGYSLHAYYAGDPDEGNHYTFHSGVRLYVGVAVDINWRDNPYGRPLRTDMPLRMVQAIERIRTNDGEQVWRSGRYWSTPDPMHYQINVSPAELASGIDWTTVPGNTPEDNNTDPEDDSMMNLIQNGGHVYAQHGVFAVHINAPSNLTELQQAGLAKPGEAIDVSDEVIGELVLIEQDLSAMLGAVMTELEIIGETVADVAEMQDGGGLSGKVSGTLEIS